MGNKKSVTVLVLNAKKPWHAIDSISTLFGSSPAIKIEILAKAFGILNVEADMIKKGFEPTI